MSHVGCCVHCSGAGLAADVAHLDASNARRLICGEARAQFGVAIVSLLPDLADGRGDVCIAGLGAAHEAAEVITLCGKQAQVKLAFGGETGAVAVTAERLGDAADDSDLTQSGVEGASRIGLAFKLGGGAATAERDSPRRLWFTYEESF